MLIDSHCHLDLVEEKCGDAIPLILDRARKNGVSHMQTICLSMKNFPKILTIAKNHRNVFCSVGAHPCYVASTPPLSSRELLEATREQKVIGLGETGLDLFRAKDHKDLQERSFITHIEIARKTGLPVIVHSRSAEEETLFIMRKEHEKGFYPSLIHCFSGGRAFLEGALDLGAYISLSGITTFSNARSLRDLVLDIPLDRLLLETDAPYLAPKPFRGKVCEPGHLVHTASCVASLRGINVSTLAEITTKNFFTLFKRCLP